MSAEAIRELVGANPGQATAAEYGLVHDCDRRVERECCDRFLGPARLVDEVVSMRHYRTG